MTDRPSRRTAGTLALVGLASSATLVAGLMVVAARPGRMAVDPVTSLAPAALVSPAVPSAAPRSGQVASAPADVGHPEVAWVKRIASRTGIGAIALSAYAAADLRLGVQQPRCRLSWSTLAGVGYVESRHGTIGGRRLGPDGRPGLTPIFGVALTGAGPVAHLADTDDGRLDGDAQYDRGIGPMQFVPSSWRKWGSDGDGDGASDPQDVYDAAYSAGRYLCASGVPLNTAVAWTRAVLSYNPSDAYVRDVLAAANAYASRSIG